MNETLGFEGGEQAVSRALVDVDPLGDLSQRQSAVPRREAEQDIQRSIDSPNRQRQSLPRFPKDDASALETCTRQNVCSIPV